MTVANQPNRHSIARTRGLSLGSRGPIVCCRRAMLVISLVFPILIGSALSASASQERRISLSYDVFYGGIKATSLEVDIVLSDLMYRLESKVVARGPFGWVTGFVVNAISRGSVSGNDLNLGEHSNTSEWFGEQRSVALRPGINGAIDVAVVPAPEKDDRDSVPLASTIGTLDPLSASLKAARDIQRTDACEQTLPIFDGRKRYDLIFRDTLRTSIKGKYYSGPALRCRLDLNRIAGFSRTPFLPRPEKPPEAFVWLARIDQNVPMIPIRLRVSSSVATTMIHLTGITRPESN